MSMETPLKRWGAKGHGIYLCYEAEQSGRNWQRERKYNPVHQDPMPPTVFMLQCKIFYRFSHKPFMCVL